MRTASKLVMILFIELIPICVLTTFFFVDLQSTWLLLIFNFIFISILLKLNGGLSIKLGLLAAGNAIGLVWNYCFHQLVSYAYDSLIVYSAILNLFYVVSYPFLNSLWIISFWSLCLTALHNHESFRRKLQL